MRDTIYRYNTPLRIALLADLHDRDFGWITDSLKARKPDIICIAGDVVHRVDTNTDGLAIHQTKYVLPFLKACADIAPTFMSLGNHEWTLCDEDIVYTDSPEPSARTFRASLSHCESHPHGE